MWLGNRLAHVFLGWLRPSRHRESSDIKSNGEETVLRGFLIGAATAVAVMASTGAFAQKAGYGSAEEAKAMLEKAVVALKANEAAALADFAKPDGEFRDRDLYVYCFEMSTGKFTAHVNPRNMGTDVRALLEKTALHWARNFTTRPKKEARFKHGGNAGDQSCSDWR
jgi:hypothetical protein